MLNIKCLLFDLTKMESIGLYVTREGVIPINKGKIHCKHDVTINL